MACICKYFSCKKPVYLIVNCPHVSIMKTSLWTDVNSLLNIHRLVLPFQPKYPMGPPEKYLFSWPEKIFFRSKSPKKSLFHFENRSTGTDIMLQPPMTSASSLKFTHSWFFGLVTKQAMPWSSVSFFKIQLNVFLDYLIL